MKFPNIKKHAPKVHALLAREIKRQQETLDLIPSENIASPAVLEALGSPLTNKYSEGYPGKRYYPGNLLYDEIERAAQDLARKVFKLRREWQVNVQPYSGSPANIAVYMALLRRGDTLLGMILSHGGHLTHGHRVNISGKWFRSIQYGVGEDGRIDYEAVRKLARAHKPHLIVAGATAYPRTIDFKKFGAIAREVHAIAMADIAHIAGLIATGLHPSPFSYMDVVTTTTHKSLRGPRGAIIFAKNNHADAIDRAVFPGLQGGPHNNVTAAMAVALTETMQPSFARYQRQVCANARALAEALARNEFILVGGGTDTHLILLDLRNKNISGSVAEELLEHAGIIANRNSIPDDVSPFRPSGLRLGTPSITTRGLKEKEMRKIGEWIDRVLTTREDPRKVGKEVHALAKKFPLPY